MPTLDDAIQHIRMGNHEKGRQILEELLEVDETNEDIWLWLTSVVDSEEDIEICLENVLALNPNNVLAQRGLEALSEGRFDANEMLSEVLEEEAAKEVTFIDDFAVADEEEELEFPGSMTESSKAAKGKKRGGVNTKVIVILVAAILVVLGLGGVAAVALFMGFDGSDSTPVENVTSPEGPVEIETVEPLPTDSPTPEPTPTATDTPLPRLELPTPKPTDPPTPTATQVVSPTPPN